LNERPAGVRRGARPRQVSVGDQRLGCGCCVRFHHRSDIAPRRRKSPPENRERRKLSGSSRGWRATTTSALFLGVELGLCRGDLSTELLQLIDSLRASEACQVGGDLEGGHALKPPPECHVRMTTRGLYPHLRNLQIVTPGVAPVTFFFFSWFW
jgi:hypothetical protein